VLIMAGTGLLLATLLLSVLALKSLTAPLPGVNAPVLFVVTPGSSLSGIGQQLAAEELISNRRLFVLWARWRGYSSAIQAGEYLLEPGISSTELLNKLVSGDHIQYRLTLVEGWTIEQALGAIWNSVKVSRQLDAYDPQQIMELLNVDYASPEGILFPDTYFYTAGTSDIALLQRAHTRLNSVLAEAWESRVGALPFESSYEALILASLVEKESALASERGQIAGVFVRRLELGMRLQSDPTVLYGMSRSFVGDIRRSDLATETPYNTYRVDGLPPTPIALTGRGAIMATMQPEITDALYFVGRGDGSHQFSATLQEHNDAVNLYQRGNLQQ